VLGYGEEEQAVRAWCGRVLSVTTRKTSAAAKHAEPEPEALGPEMTELLSRASDAAHEDLRDGRTISGEEHLRRLRARDKQRRAG
jgi:hypothetical protein